MEEHWVRIKENPNYLISDLGNVYNLILDREVRVTPNTHGHMRIGLMNYETGDRVYRSVAKLVAQAFVDPPPSPSLCDYVIILNGDFGDLRYDNLAWRPKTFAWRYTHQLKTDQPTHYHNLKVMDVDRGIRYRSIVDAGVEEGLLFDDIWRSTHSGNQVFPSGSVFTIE